MTTPGIAGHTAASPDELEQLGEEIAELAAHVDATTHQLLVRLREFDEREGWNVGFPSCAHWLSWRAGIASGAAREKVRVARALADLPRLGRALELGELSYSKVRALTRIATPANEEDLLELARHATAAQVETVVRAWRRVDRLEEAKQERERHEARQLTVRVDDDGSYVVHGRLDPEVGALLERALDAAAGALYDEQRAGSGRRERSGAGASADDAPAVDESQPPSPSQRRADALCLLVELALASGELRTGESGQEFLSVEQGASESIASWSSATKSSATKSSATKDDPAARTSRTHGNGSAGASVHPRRVAGKPLGRATRVQVVLHVDAEALRADSDSGQSVLAGGVRVPAETSRRLACDASRVVMTHDANGTVLDVGRRTRTVPPAIRRALEHRDRGCRFPGCGNRFTDAHHVHHWADGGATRLGNLVLLCRRHHRAVHEEGYRVSATAGGDFVFGRPDGRPMPQAPPMPMRSPEPAAGVCEPRPLSGRDAAARVRAPLAPYARLDLDWTLRVLYR